MLKVDFRAKKQEQKKRGGVKANTSIGSRWESCGRTLFSSQFLFFYTNMWEHPKFQREELGQNPNKALVAFEYDDITISQNWIAHSASHEEEREPPSKNTIKTYYKRFQTLYHQRVGHGFSEEVNQSAHTA